MKIVDAHNHLVYPNGGERASDPDIIDPQYFIDEGSIDQMWFLSVGDCIRHPYDDINEAVLDLSRRFPDFAIPFAFLDYHKTPDIVDDFKARGFAGLKAHFPDWPYDDERNFPFYERAEKLNMPILFHCGGAGIDPPDVGLFANFTFPQGALNRNCVIETLDPICKYFPKLTVIGAHMGGRKGFHYCVEMARSNDNFHFDISCSPLARQWQDQFRDVIEYAGARKILFGSDCRGNAPIIYGNFWKYYFMTRCWGDTDSRKAGELICGQNALRIIGESGYDPKRIQPRAGATAKE
jgi:predicted TIM-barrel fold metal-dependent hydrolase